MFRSTAPELSAKLVARWTLHRVRHDRPEDQLLRHLARSGHRRAEADTVSPNAGSMKGTPRISPDGRWMAYSSNESGRPGVYVTRAFRSPSASGRCPPTAEEDFPSGAVTVASSSIASPMETLMAVPIASRRRVRARRADSALPAAGCRVGGWAWARSTTSRRTVGSSVNIFVERTSPPATVVLNWRQGGPVRSSEVPRFRRSEVPRSHSENRP